MRWFLCFWICCGLGLSGTPQVQEKCGAEVKLLLLPSDVQSAVRSFNAGRGVPGKVYFYDTATLDLFSEGIIVRVRRGASADLTVKLRPSADKNIADVSGRDGKFKCEIDLTDGVALRSYSIQTKLNGALPETGNEVFSLLSAAQKQLLEQAHVSIDWSRVKRIADIRSTDWQIRGQPSFPKLVLELWEWPADAVLELSSRVSADTAPVAYRELQQLAASHGLSRSSRQSSKTELALEESVHATVH